MPNECSEKRTEALTPNGHVSSAKSLMDGANYQKLGRPYKRSGSICDLSCCTHSWMLNDDIHWKHGNNQECIVGEGMERAGEGEHQECSVLSFPKHVGSKRIPPALTKKDNRHEEEQ